MCSLNEYLLFVFAVPAVEPSALLVVGKCSTT